MYIYIYICLYNIIKNVRQSKNAATASQFFDGLHNSQNLGVA